MNKVLKEKIMEAFSSVMPITAIVLVASVFLVPMSTGTILTFLVGAALLIVGMGFFTLGADMAMIPMGEGIGVQLTKTTNIAVALLVIFVMGLVITIAEPDLQVLSEQVPSIPNWNLILTVACGVGFFLVLALLRILFRIQLSFMLLVFYLAVFALVAFVPPRFVPVAFDSGGVTTGPVTVPFILALGIGAAAIRTDRRSQEDSFGLVALCSIGPVLAVLLLGIFFTPSGAEPESHGVPSVATSRDVVAIFAREFPRYAGEIFKALGAILGFFALFQVITRRFKRHRLGRIVIGFFYTFAGLVVFLTGVNVGFIPVGQFLGSELARSSFKWILVPLGMLFGYFIVKAEPAVIVLNKQVEEISSGAIPQSVMQRGLSIGMAAALGLSMVRILYGISLLWILIPGYAAALALTFFVPRIFTGIAFDSGGVCTGPMTSTFLLPLAMGTAEGAGRGLMENAFGIIAVIAMAPLVVIQILGLIYRSKLTVQDTETREELEALTADADADVIVEYDVYGAGGVS
jgi:ABC-type multidrug transport system fused ATPase/permease subunit